jgi:hypothetical protein
VTKIVKDLEFPYLKGCGTVKYFVVLDVARKQKEREREKICY